MEVGSLCCLHDSQGVARLWTTLNDEAKEWARYVCNRYGVGLPK
jgi:hypothetical protein